MHAAIATSRHGDEHRNGDDDNDIDDVCAFPEKLPDVASRTFARGLASIHRVQCAFERRLPGFGYCSRFVSSILFHLCLPSPVGLLPEKKLRISIGGSPQLNRVFSFEMWIDGRYSGPLTP